MFLINLKFAFQSMKENILKTFLAVLQIALGMTIIIASINLEKQMIARVERDYKDFEEVVRVDMFGYSALDFYHENALEKIKASDVFMATSFAFNIDVVFAKSKYGINALRDCMLVDEDFVALAGLKLLAGNFFTASDIKQASFCMLLEKSVAQGLFGGYEKALGEKLLLKEGSFSTGFFEGDVDSIIGEFEIIGVYENNRADSDWAAMASSSLLPWTSSELYSEYSWTWPRFVGSVPPGRTIAETRELLASLVNIGEEEFYLIPIRDAYNVHHNWARRQNYYLNFLASFTLLAAGISILCINIVNTVAKTKSIGLKRALGARRRNIMKECLLESALISFLGACLSLVIAYFVQFVFHYQQDNMYSIYYKVESNLMVSTIFLSLGLALLMGLVFGFYPAWQATRISPTEILKED